MKSFVPAALAGALLACAGCDHAPPPAAPAPPTAGSDLPTHAQSKLATIKLWLGSEELEAEVAATPLQEETGMMFRTNLDEHAGMIFILPEPERASFWMTNCPLPLAAAYIDPQGTILEEHELHSNDATPVLSTAENVQFVLEVNSNWFDRHHIGVGTLITTEHGSLPDVFLRRQ